MVYIFVSLILLLKVLKCVNRRHQICGRISNTKILVKYIVFIMKIILLENFSHGLSLKSSNMVVREDTEVDRQIFFKPTHISY